MFGIRPTTTKTKKSQRKHAENANVFVLFFSLNDVSIESQKFAKKL